MRTKPTLKEHWRIIWTIALKDMLDAIKNRTILSVVVGMGMMMVTAQAFPLLLKLAEEERVVVYDASGSTQVAEWDAGGELAVIEVDSFQEVEATLARMNSQVLGVVLPADLESQLNSDEPVRIEGYVVWSARHKADELAVNMAGHMQSILDHPVRVHVDGNLVYPPADDNSGQLSMVGMTLVLIVGMTGSFLVPYLIFEEKQAHTMEALLVSPASAGQITQGKALAGLLYCLVAMLVAFAFNYWVVVNWSVVLLTALAASLVSIAVGLLLGSLFESAQQMGFWMGLPLIFWFAPIILLTGNSGLPPVVNSILSWLPGALISENFLFSFSNAVAWDTVLLNLAILVAWSLPFFMIVVWIVRRSDR